MRADPHFARDLVLLLVAILLLFLYVTSSLAIPWVVGGPSMKPTLEPGDRVLVDLWTYRQRAPRIGEVALLAGPGSVPIVKRVAESSRDERREAEKEWFGVRGDNPGESLDSRQFGPVPRNRFEGRVLFRYWPLSRAGRIR